MGNWFTRKIVNTVHWTDRLCSLQVEAPISPFVAGQFTRLALTLDGEQVARPYSFVNPPDADYAEFYLNIVDEGPLSGRLATLEPGDELHLAETATGFFTLEEVPASKHLWMLATGTALGPYLSILETRKPWETYSRIVLVHAVKTADELTYLNPIQKYQDEHPEQFQYIPFVSREQTSHAMPGRIPAAIEDSRLSKATGLEITPEDSQVMICGNLPMIKDTTEALNQLGLVKNRRSQPGHITTEKYF